MLQHPTPAQHQAQGLQRLFSGQAARLVSVLAGPSAPDTHTFVLNLAAALAERSQRVWLVETELGTLSDSLGCHPLLPWQASRSLEEQLIRADNCGLLHAPGCLAGDATFAGAVAACRDCDVVLFDGGRFSLAQAPLNPCTAQTLVVLLGRQDLEAGYALVKGLQAAHSPARLLLIGEAAELVAQAASHFMGSPVEGMKTGPGLCQIGNSWQETSSNTLTIGPNLIWVVSRITQNDQPKVAHGGCGEGAEEVNQR
jgi:hypothetical protein